MTVHPINPVPSPGDHQIPGGTAAAPAATDTQHVPETTGAATKHPTPQSPVPGQPTPRTAPGRAHRRGRLQPLDRIPARTPAIRITTRWNHNPSSGDTP